MLSIRHFYYRGSVSLLWCGFCPCPGNFHMPRVRPRKKKKSKGNVTPSLLLKSQHFNTCMPTWTYVHSNPCFVEFITMLIRSWYGIVFMVYGIVFMGLPMKIQINTVLREGAWASDLLMDLMTGLQDSAGEKENVMHHRKQTQILCISK